jgi:hypothetical protein
MQQNPLTASRQERVPVQTFCSGATGAGVTSASTDVIVVNLDDLTGGSDGLQRPQSDSKQIKSPDGGSFDSLRLQVPHVFVMPDASVCLGADEREGSDLPLPDLPLPDPQAPTPAQGSRDAGEARSLPLDRPRYSGLGTMLHSDRTAGDRRRGDGAAGSVPAHHLYWFQVLIDAQRK